MARGRFVDRRRIELRFLVCRTSVFPLDEQPVAGPAGTAPASVVLEATLALRPGPVATPKGIEPSSHRRQRRSLTRCLRGHGLRAANRTRERGV